MRSKKAIVNTAVQIILELVTILSGFILPRLIISVFGSDANGLVVSITQFFGYLTLLQSGIGGIAKAALYKPLADNDTRRISALVKAIESFFKKIGYISIAYMAILAVIFPIFIYPSGNTVNTALLVFIIWIGVFSQYYFGITYQFLLQADQKYYIYSITQIIVVVVNTILSIILIKIGASLATVKLFSSVIFVVRPIILSKYCRKKYSLNRSVEPATELLTQRWDGFGHTVAYFIHSKTDVFVLTIFSTLVNVSIYSVSASISAGLSLLMNTIATSVQSAFGNMIARKEKETLKRNFTAYICLNNAMVMVLFSTAIICIIPFMKLYTRNFASSGYINKNFSFLLLLAEASFCIRMPFQTVVLAAGHYKQTRNGAFVEAALNICISLLLVRRYDIIGVAVGTLFAMVFRTIQYTIYLSKNIVSVSLKSCFIGMCADFLFLSVSYFLSLFTDKISIVSSISNYFQWMLFAMLAGLSMSVFAFILLLMLDRGALMNVIKILRRSLKKSTVPGFQK